MGTVMGLCMHRGSGTGGRCREKGPLAASQLGRGRIGGRHILLLMGMKVPACSAPHSCISAFTAFLLLLEQLWAPSLARSQNSERDGEGRTALITPALQEGAGRWWCPPACTLDQTKLLGTLLAPASKDGLMRALDAPSSHGETRCPRTWHGAAAATLPGASSPHSARFIHQHAPKNRQKLGGWRAASAAMGSEQGAWNLILWGWGVWGWVHRAGCTGLGCTGLGYTGLRCMGLGCTGPAPACFGCSSFRSYQCGRMQPSLCQPDTRGRRTRGCG